MDFEKYFFLQIPIMHDRKIPIIIGIIIIFIVIIDLLMTRQILPYTNDMENLMFILTVFIGWGRILVTFRIYYTNKQGDQNQI